MLEAHVSAADLKRIKFDLVRAKVKLRYGVKRFSPSINLGGHSARKYLDEFLT